MAKRRRKKTKLSGRRRSRKSSIHGIDFTNILGVIGGAVVAGYLNKVIPETIDNKIVAGGKIALGVVLPMLVKTGSMKNILGGVGSGMVAVGSVELLKEFGVLNGPEEDEMLEISLSGDQDVLASDDDMSVINADVLSGDGDEEDINVVNGFEDMDEEY